MADKEISDLTAATSTALADLLHIVQGGNSRQATLELLRDTILGSESRPQAADFTQLTTASPGTISVADSSVTGSDGIILTFNPNTTSRAGAFAGQAVTPSVDFTMTARVAFGISTNNYQYVGLGLQGTSSDEASILGYYNDGDDAPHLRAAQYTSMSGNTVAAAVSTAEAHVLSQFGSFAINWHRAIYTHSTGHVEYQISLDGINWFSVSVQDAAGNLTGGVDYAGFAFYSTASVAGDVNTLCDHFEITY